MYKYEIVLRKRDDELQVGALVILDDRVKFYPASNSDDVVEKVLRAVESGRLSLDELFGKTAAETFVVCPERFAKFVRFSARQVVEIGTDMIGNWEEFERTFYAEEEAFPVDPSWEYNVDPSWEYNEPDYPDGNRYLDEMNDAVQGWMD